MNVLEAMSVGCQPLIHNYPGAENQWDKEFIWNDFDDLIKLYEKPYEPEKYRQYIVDNYDYRKTCLPVAEAIEEYS